LAPRWRRRQHAEELGDELLAGVGAEQVAALQVGEQVAGVAGAPDVICAVSRLTTLSPA